LPNGWPVFAAAGKEPRALTRFSQLWIFSTTKIRWPSRLASGLSRREWKRARALASFLLDRTKKKHSHHLDQRRSAPSAMSVVCEAGAHSSSMKLDRQRTVLTHPGTQGTLTQAPPHPARLPFIQVNSIAATCRRENNCRQCVRCWLRPAAPSRGVLRARQSGAGPAHEAGCGCWLGRPRSGLAT